MTTDRPDSGSQGGDMLKTPSEWEAEIGCKVLDPDGWRNDGKSWSDAITRFEFERRAVFSTVRWPMVKISEDTTCTLNSDLAAERAAHAETLRVLGELVDVVETHMEWSPRKEWGHRFSEREVPRIARRHLRKHEGSTG